MSPVSQTRADVPRQIVLPLLLVLLAVAAYARALPGPFILDDAPVVATGAAMLRNAGPLMAPRALVNLTFALNYGISGLATADYRALNILIHVAAACVLWGLIRRTLRLASWGRAPWASPAADWAAFACAAAWTLHPLLTQSVTYICQRYESMTGLLIFLSLYAFVRSLDSPHPSRWLDISVCICGLGMFAKQTMVAAPLLILCYAWVFCDRNLISRRRFYFLALCLTWLILGLLLGLSAATMSEAGPPVLSSVSAGRYLLTQASVILHYLRLGLFPYGLCFDYDWQATENLRDGLFPLLVTGALVLVCLHSLVRRRPFGFLGCAFFLLLAPTSSILPVLDIAVEHRMYAPLAPLMVGVVLLFIRLLETLPAGGGATRAATGTPGPALPLVLAVALVPCAVLLPLTVARNSVYASEISIWADTVAKRPANLRARLALSDAFMAAGDLPAAQTAVNELLPRVTLDDYGRLTPAQRERILYYRPLALNQHGRLLLLRGQNLEARDLLERLSRDFPADPVILNNLAVAHLVTGDTRAALQAALKSVSLAPDYARGYVTLAAAQATAGRKAEAERSLRTALRIVPDDPAALAQLDELMAGIPAEAP